MGRPACWWKEIEVQLAGSKWWLILYFTTGRVVKFY
jgi:hypothetical protein